MYSENSRNNNFPRINGSTDFRRMIQTYIYDSIKTAMKCLSYLGSIIAGATWNLRGEKCETYWEL